LFEEAIHNVVINDRESQSITQTLVHPKPGMFVAECMTGSQLVTPGGTVHILIELVIQMTLHALLFQPAHGAA
jgi:hypothetical protein